ncbi:DEAD/DEAH box helicase [Chloroflexota bacterium]
MVRMIPTTLQKVPGTTAGERKVFDILKKTLLEDVVVRYEVMLGMQDYRPDYTIIDPERGVIIIEVKDWGVDKITEATQEQFWVRGFRGKSSPKPQMNPALKCQIYMRDARGALLAMPLLRDEKDHLVIPVEYFLAFPNISRKAFLEAEFDQIIPVDNVFFQEDLIHSGEPFIVRYKEKLEKLSADLTVESLDEITRALFPDIIIPKVSQAGFVSTESKVVHADRAVVDTYQLSLDQEEIAKSLGEGPRLLRGIAGTGKTLILLYRAKLLAANDPKQRILILCWNTALGNYMKQAYEKFEIEAKGEVVVTHFTEFARKLLGIRSDPATGWDDSRVMKRLESIKIPSWQQYDAIFIDEAQDFRKEWIEYIFSKLLKGDPKQRNLIIAADDAQRVYKQRDFSWKSLGIPMTGRSKILKTIYRNSARVWIFSAFLLEDKATYVRDQESADKLQFSTKGGYDPQLIQCKDLDEQIDKAIEIIESMLAKNLSARNVLILYRHRYVSWLNYPLVDRLLERLNSTGIAADWIAKHSEAKRSFDWVADTIKISTVHSAKGMDSPVVIVLGAETFSTEEDSDTDELRLMYVALTRAREFLVVLYSGNSGMVPNLKKCQKEYQKYRDKIISIES